MKSKKEDSLEITIMKSQAQDAREQRHVSRMNTARHICQDIYLSNLCGFFEDKIHIMQIIHLCYHTCKYFPINDIRRFCFSFVLDYFPNLNILLKFFLCVRISFLKVVIRILLKLNKSQISKALKKTDPSFFFPAWTESTL